ncbi:Fatty acid desaturase [Rhodotorula toruloides ATCC 204091]|uniref:BY PROTMAP: gi/342319192/gb/EGU11142.1/ Fatty acid desaturase [Rhodotorula glutinis ATCC 204091] n=1 Tax=Rhodotorula toruloides TaxID=5286 RepID=A0A0K3CQM8_RHOTO|nr:Fatty acid desaturase [Rhodotorula toruloides ATCC 204091]
MRGSEEGRGQIAAIEERLEADEQKMKAVSPPVFLNLAKAAVGLEAYEHVMGDKQSWSDADAERLGREYGRQLARLCGPPILYQLHAVLKRMASVAGGPEGSAWLKGNEPELVAQWQQMDGMQQETLLRRCEHALQHTEEFHSLDRRRFIPTSRRDTLLRKGW